MMPTVIEQASQINSEINFKPGEQMTFFSFSQKNELRWY